MATIYNTVHAFKNAGHLREVEVRGKKTYFDTNVTNHHHFYDSETSELIDIDENEVIIQKIVRGSLKKKKEQYLCATKQQQRQQQQSPKR